MALTMLISMMTGLTAQATETSMLNLKFDLDANEETDTDIDLFPKQSASDKAWSATGGYTGGAIKFTATKDSGTSTVRIFNAPNVMFKRGGTYTISFRIKGSKDGISSWLAPNIAVQLPNGNYSDYGGGAISPGITTQWKTHTMTFTIQELVNSASNPTPYSSNERSGCTLMANFGNIQIGDEIWVDDFVVTEEIGGATEMDLSKTENTCISVGGTTQIVAEAFDMYGEAATAPITYSSDDTSVAVVSESGLVTGQKEGTAVITATCGKSKKSIVIMVGSLFRQNAYDSGTISPNITAETWGEKNVKWENAQELDNTFKRTGTASLHLKNLDRFTGNGSTATQGPLLALVYQESDKYPDYGAMQIWYYENGENENRDFLIQFMSSATKTEAEMAGMTLAEKSNYRRFNFAIRAKANNGYTTFGDGFGTIRPNSNNGDPATPESIQWGTVDYTIPRTKGWHQLVQVSTPTGHKIYIDGQLFADVPKTNQKVGGITIHRLIPSGVNEGNNELWFDDYVLMNTAAYDDVTVNIEGDGGTVTKDGEAVANGTKYNVLSGTEMTFRVIPQEGYDVAVQKDGQTVTPNGDNDVTFATNGDSVITVTFTKKPDINAGIEENATYNWFKMDGEVPTMFVYSKLSQFTTGESNLNYGIWLWDKEYADDKVQLNAYDPVTKQPAVATPGAMFAIRAYGDAIKADRQYGVQPFIGEETGDSMDITFE
ncbi:MAG: hypothetical protein E7399_01545 [Ruminococcaceae bacterium]|nr:hypothetical protein [Oscillospiraceae bacterium]